MVVKVLVFRVKVLLVWGVNFSLSGLCTGFCTGHCCILALGNWDLMVVVGFAILWFWIPGLCLLHWLVLKGTLILYMELVGIFHGQY